MAEAISTSNRFGPFVVQYKLGAGGMAVVYKAYNEETGATIALKILRASLAEQSGIVERFKQEARIANRLKHRHIVDVLSYGAIKGRYYLEMQYMPGGTLAKRFQQPVEIGAQEAVRLLREVSSALDYAHRQGVVHRDLKLENILLDHRGSARLSDFGIARIVDGTRLTVTGSVIGTPMYISPEQARGGLNLDYRADLYSLAVIAYVLTVGRFPFNADNVLAIINQHVSEPAPTPSHVNPKLPPTLDLVLMRGLAKRPEERYPSADTFIEHLARALADQPPASTLIIDLKSASGAQPKAAHKAGAAPQTADEWVQAAIAAGENHAEAIACLKRALDLEPLHSKANRMLFQLEGSRPRPAPKPAERTAPAAPAPAPTTLEPLKQVKRDTKKNATWNIVALAGFIVLSLTSIFIVLSFLGQAGGVVSTIQQIQGTPAPVLEVQGTPVRQIPGIVLTVEPVQTKPLAAEAPASDVLDAGRSHAYTFQARPGEEVAIAIQFFSPTANGVGSNVAVLRPNGTNADGACERDQILQGDNGVAFICRIDQGGQWELRVFGIEGQSTGAYVVTIARM